MNMNINWSLAIEYGLGFILATSIIIFFIPYFRNRIKEGIINALAIAGLIFFVSYDFKMAVGIWIRVSNIMYDINPLFREFQTAIWAVAQGMVVVSLGIIVYLLFSKKYDVWFQLKKFDPDKSKRVEKMVEEIMKENDITPETINKLGKEDEDGTKR